MDDGDTPDEANKTGAKKRKWTDPEGMIIHENSSIVIKFAGNRRPRAFLEYEIDEKLKTLDICHTFTVRAHRGKGYASRLATAAFQFARERGLRVIPSCTYISDTYLPRMRQLAPESIREVLD